MRSIAVLWTIFWHYVTFTKERKEHSIQDKSYDVPTKKKHRREIFMIMKELSRRMLKAAGTTVVVKGRENLPEKGPVVYMVTHKGHYDSLVVADLLEDASVFIGKEEMRKMPFFNDWFDAMGCIYLARDDVRQSMQAIMQGIQELI